MYLNEHHIADRVAEIDRHLAAFEAASLRRREAEIECARELEALQLLDAWSFAGCASAGELGERHAVPASEARNLLGLGRAMKALPYLEQQVRSGRITVASAGCLGEVLSDPTLQRSEDDWIGWAQTESTLALKHRVQKRKEEARMGDAPAVGLTVFVRPQVIDEFRRARTVASRKALKALSEGETLACVVTHYLDSFDEERTQPGQRRLPDTAFVAGRYVPAAVRREVYERQDGRCAVPMCDHTMFLNLAHLVPHACGGSREADNLVLLCRYHHFWFDAGYMTLAGTAAQPTFIDRLGRDLTRRFARGEFKFSFGDPVDEPSETTVLARHDHSGNSGLPPERGRPSEALAVAVLPACAERPARPGPAPP